MPRMVTAATRLPHLEKGVESHAYATSPLFADLKGAGCIKKGPWSSVSWNIRGERTAAEIALQTYGQYQKGTAQEVRDTVLVTCEGGQYAKRKQLSGLDKDINLDAMPEDKIIDVMQDTADELIDEWARGWANEVWNGTGAASTGRGGQSILGLYTAIGRATITSETLYGYGLSNDGWNPIIRLYNSGDTGVYIDDINELFVETEDAIRAAGGTPTHAYARSSVVNQLIINYLNRNQTRLETVSGVPGVAITGTQRRFRMPTGTILTVDDNAPANTIYIMDLKKAVELRFGNTPGKGGAKGSGNDGDEIMPPPMELEWLPRDTDYDDDVFSLRARTKANFIIRHPELIGVVTTAA